MPKFKKLTPKEKEERDKRFEIQAEELRRKNEEERKRKKETPKKKRKLSPEDRKMKLKFDLKMTKFIVQDMEEHSRKKKMTPKDLEAKKQFEENFAKYTMALKNGTYKDDDYSDDSDDDDFDEDDYDDFSNSDDQSDSYFDDSDDFDDVKQPTLKKKKTSDPVFYEVQFSLPRHKFNRLVRFPVANTTLHHLHNLIMEAFQWDDDHLHKFETCLGSFTDRTMAEKGKEERQCPLERVLDAETEGMGYVYDFASEWDVDISLKAILTEEEMKDGAQKLGIQVPNDLSCFAYISGGKGGIIDEESGEMDGKFNIKKENAKISRFNVWK